MNTVSANRTRPGFTLIEIIVVLGVIMALAGLGFPIMSAVRQRANVQSTRSLVQGVAAAISMYPVRQWTIEWDHDGDDPDNDGYGSGSARATARKSVSVPLWDLNQGASPAADGTGQFEGDDLIDGFPATSAGATNDGPFWSTLLDSGYGGFLRMTNAPISSKSVNAQGQVIDAWRQPLRIEWNARTYAPSGFGVWSIGRDKTTGTPDDLCSWRNSDD
ncbi:MAG: prepilin-type N-terminal cleavage/methylation domain-containing protein [Planctomycetes bacterium]|nr:prepilin-type N-terminal cleavage/methylation domain-containing protein [Planctomycetota bacterium]